MRVNKINSPTGLSLLYKGKRRDLSLPLKFQSAIPMLSSTLFIMLAALKLQYFLFITLVLNFLFFSFQFFI